MTPQNQAGHAVVAEEMRTLRAAQAVWLRIDALAQSCLLHLDPERQEQLSLLRLDAGGRIAPRPAGSDEELLVLAGRCRIAGRVFEPGGHVSGATGGQFGAIVASLSTLVLLRSRPRFRMAAEPAPPMVSEGGAAARWQLLSSKTSCRVLLRDPGAGRRSTLYRLLPGGEIQVNCRRMPLDCYVASGQISIGDLQLGRGDFHHAAPAPVPAPLRAIQGAWVWLRSDAARD